MVKFLKKRHEFISLDMDYVRTHIDIKNFTEKDDKILLIYCIVQLKNANNLILELGPYSYLRFVLDTKTQLLDAMTQKSKKRTGSDEIIDSYILN